MKKKLLAILLTVCMVLSMAPAALAADAVFTDVNAGDWFAEEVKYVYDNGLMNGVGDNAFDPSGTVTRAMVWTTLARQDGVNTAGSDPWWLAGQKWAMENGISDGTMATENITREQLVTMIWRYAKYIDMDVSEGEDTNILSYTDALDVNEWAISAMQWACAVGIINGIDGALQPQGDASRAMLAAILYRFVEEVMPEEEEPEPSTPVVPNYPSIPVHFHSWTAGTPVAPTCTEQGYTPYTCVCGASKNGDTVPAVSHVAGVKCPHCGVTEVETAEQLAAALSADDEKIDVVLLKDIEVPVADLSQWGQTPGSGEYKLGGDSTTAIIIDLNEHKLTLTTGYMTAIGAKNDNATITIKNGSMNGTGNSATTWNINDLIFANCNYVFEKVTFEKEVALCNTGKTVTMTDVTIKGTGDYYALWIQAEGQTVNIDGLTVNTPGRGIKIDDQYVSAENLAKVTLNVSDAKFTTAKKAAIMVKSAAGADITLSEVDISAVVADTVNEVWIDEDAAAYQQLVTVTGGNKILEGAVAKIGDMYYSTLQEAVDAATDGNTIALLKNGTYDIPNGVAGKTITIEGAGADTKFDFTKAYAVNDANITFKNLYFQGKNENVMNGFGIQHTTGLIAYENCTFDGAVTNEHFGTVSYKNCTFTGTGYITTYAVKSASFENCVFDKADSRAVLVYSHGDNPCKVTLTECTFKAAAKATTWAGDWTAAVEVDTTNIPTAGTTVTITNCNADENYSGIVRDKSAAGKANAMITVDGKVASTATLIKFIEDGKTTIELAAGNFTLPNAGSKNITLVGVGPETVVDYSHMGGYQEVSGSSFVFKNMTVVNAEAGYPYKGLQHITSVSYEDCHITGTVNLFAPATFTNCTFDSKSAEHNVVTYGSDSVTFTDCKFTYGDRAVNCYAANASARDVKVSFTGCTFTKVAGKETTGAIETNSSLMNSLTLTINDCTVNEGELWFVAGWDSLGGAKTTIIIDGKQWVSTQEALAAAINRGATTIYLTDGNYYVPACQGKTITIKGGTGAVVDASDNSYGYQTLSSANITFDGVTIKGTDSNFTCKGFQHATVKFNKCTIVNELILNENSEFTDCIFNTTGDIYSIWTWGARTATFTRCTFNTDSKTILMFGGAAGTSDGEITTVLTLDTCTFNDSGVLTAKKAAVEIGNGYTNANYKLVADNTTVNGYEINDEGTNTGSTLWGNKNSMGTDTLDVIIDGVDAY